MRVNVEGYTVTQDEDNVIHSGSVSKYVTSDSPPRSISVGSLINIPGIGRIKCTGQDFAITEDDRLKYSCKWMELEKKPQHLLKFLEGKCLLVLGCGYENWQNRFFLYGLKQDFLFTNQNMNSLFADSMISSDGKMDSFLSRSQGNIYFEALPSHRNARSLPR